MTRGNCAKRYVVHGRVQGVGFRYATEKTARRLRLRGWVRNNSDGTVEVVAEGTAESIHCLLDWLSKGPPGSRITRVDSYDVKLAGTYRGFTIDY